MRGLFVALVAGALVFGPMPVNPAGAVMHGSGVQGVTAAPAVAAPAAKKKAKAPRIIVGKAVKTKTPYPQKSTRTVKLPVLQNSTAANRKKFAAYARATAKAELKPFDSSRKGYCYRDSRTSVFNTRPVKYSVYKGRYASVTMGSWFYVCGGSPDYTVRSFTMDLKTGRKMGIGSFVAQDDLSTKVAVARNYKKSKQRCTEDPVPTAGKNDEGYIPRPRAWDVSSKGIRFHFGVAVFGPKACGNTAVLLPWNQVATAKAMSGKTHHRTYIRNLPYDKAEGVASRMVLTSSVRGRKVSVFDWWIGYETYCSVGVRTGKTAIVGDTWGRPYTAKIKLRDTTANPRIDLRSLPGKGWHVASARELKQIKAENGGKLPVASSICR